MNSDATENGPYESDNRPNWRVRRPHKDALTGDWLVESKRERDFTYGIAIGGAVFAVALWGVVNYGMVHPLLAHLAAYLGVK